jgi:hypothetical protein
MARTFSTSNETRDLPTSDSNRRQSNGVTHLLSDAYCAQQKFDGKRIVLAIDRNSVTAHNRNGLVCEVSPAIIQQAHLLAPIAPLVLDSEWLRETKSLYVFDQLTRTDHYKFKLTAVSSFLITGLNQKQSRLNRRFRRTRTPC